MEWSPKNDFEETKEHGESHVVISDGVEYSVDRLIEISKSLEPTEISITEFEKVLEEECWDDSMGRKLKPKEVIKAIEDGIDEVPELKDHIERIKNSNTEYPILVVNIGGELVVLDGVHRLAKSFLEKKTRVLVVKFSSLPKEAQKDTPNLQTENKGSAEFSTKLAEYITGLRPDNPMIVERLIEDQKIIRAKYGLPKREAINNPYEYELTLRKIAGSLGVSIKSRSECGSFFEEYNNVGAAHFEKENKIGVDIDRSNLKSYSKSMSTLEHELIHALQHKNSPRMPIELMEYEAYVACGNNELLREDLELVKTIFQYLIGASVMHWYSQESKNRGEEVSPKWM